MSTAKQRLAIDNVKQLFKNNLDGIQEAAISISAQLSNRFVNLENYVNTLYEIPTEFFEGGVEEKINWIEEVKLELLSNLTKNIQELSNRSTIGINSINTLVDSKIEELLE